jgi:hypothetical protein
MGGMMIRGKLATERKLGKSVVLVAIAVAVALTVTGAASSQPLQTGTPGVSILAQNGFGDHNNSFAWSMYWFRGKLYVGTGRDEDCVENETVEFYYPDSNTYKTNPEPDVHCPKNPYNLSLRAEIWQYTPPGGSTVVKTKTTPTLDGTTTISTIVPNTGRWKMVYRAPLIKNPMTKHKMVSRDLAYRGMLTWRNPQGKQALFAAGVTPDEFMPPLLKSHPPVLMRSFDGVHWQTLHLPSVVVHYPGGNVAPMGFRSLVVWRNHLFVTATPDITGDGGLFEVTHPWSNHPGLRQVSGPQYDIFEIQTFDGGLYIGTGDAEVGYGVYRTFNYTRSGIFNFHQVVGYGAGRGHQVTSVVSMHVYRNRLYVGSSGWYNKGTIPASEMIRIAANGQWQVVVGNPRTLRDGKTLYPASGLYDGFFSPFAAHFWRMASQGHGLYVGTNDWAYLVQTDKQFAFLTETALAGVLGFNVWATCDGNDWFAVTRDAFSGDEYNFGGRSMATGGPHGDDLYIGSANQAQGTSIFDDQGDACGSLINDDRQNVGRPAALQTDSLKHGTLLSWGRSSGAARYEVERASFVPITIGLKAPPVLPNGWQMEDAMPTVTSAGTPGSVTVQLLLPGGFIPITTTDSPDYVAPKSGHYIYEVIAKSASGVASTPSNVEVTPFEGPPATFAELDSTIVSPGPGAPKLTGASAAAASAAKVRLQSLLAEAETASARGEDGEARRDVAQLQAAAGDNDALAAAAARVERRLQYANIAGAP